MKKVYIISIAIILFSTIGCDDYLDRQPQDYIGAGDFYKSSSDIQTAVIGCYNSLQEIINSGQFFLCENRSDNAKYEPTRSAGSKPDERSFSILSVMPTNTYVAAYWAASYHSIARCNLVLEHLDVVNSEELKNQFEAEVKFIRALVYFNLVRLFEGVPIVTSPISGDEAATLERSSIDKVYALIIEDLESAINLLPSNYKPDYGAANLWSAKAILAKVFLTRGDKNSAQNLLEDIVENSGYKLEANFEDLFIDSKETSQQEIIFAIRFTTGGFGLGSALANYFAPKGYLSSSSQGHNWPTGELNLIYKTTSDSVLDKRYSATIGQWEVTGDYYGKKFVPADVPVYGDDGTDFPIIRFADVLLMLAETKGMDEGLHYLNMVRNRAGAFELSTEHIGSGKLFENFQEAVLNERRLELAFEDDRFFDLLRMGKQYASDKLYSFYTSINDPEYTNDPDNPEWPNLVTNPDLYNDMLTILGKGEIEEFRFVLPIPQNDILRGVMEQNNGY